MSMQPVGHSKNGQSINRSSIRTTRSCSDRRADGELYEYRLRRYHLLMERAAVVTAKFKKKKKKSKKSVRNLAVVTGGHTIHI